MGVHYHKRPIVTDGLVFQIDAANNLCGNVTNVKNMVNPTESGSFENGTSVVDNSYSFDGVNDYIDFPLDLQPSLINHTTEFWIKFNDILSTDIFLLTEDGRYQLRRDTDTIRVVFNGNAVTGAQTPAGSIVADTWHHVVSTIDTTNDYNEVYIDGNLLATLNYTSPILFSVGGFWISYNINASLNGSVGSMKYYNRVLTASEVQQNYEATKSRYIN
jgi:hypothetical protein